MSYTYNDGDGLSVLDKTKPNGATEPVSILDDAIKQIKAYLRDETAGVAKMQADVTDALADISTLQGRVTTTEGDISGLRTDVDAGTAAIATLESTVDSLVVTAGGNPVTAIVSLSSDTNRTSVAPLSIVPFDLVNLDTDAAFNTSTGIYVVPRAGLYRLTVQLQLDVSVSSTPTDIQHYVCIKVNGTVAAQANLRRETGTAVCTLELNRLFQLAATNTVEVHYQLTTASGTMTSIIKGLSIGTIFQISRLSA